MSSVQHRLKKTPLAAPNPSNRANINVFTTGPTIQTRFADRNLIGVEATYWNRVVRDALVARQFPVTGGFRATQLDNIGEIEGQGLELGVNGRV